MIYPGHFPKYPDRCSLPKKTEIVRGIRRRVEIVSHYTSFFYTHQADPSKCFGKLSEISSVHFRRFFSNETEGDRRVYSN